jgi:hypothetical protein
VIDTTITVNGIAPGNLLGAETSDEVGIREEWRDGQLVHICPPGVAQGAFDLRNRGLNIALEITCWSNPETAFRLTTGGGCEPQRLHPSASELWQASRTCTSETEFQTWAARWHAEARRLPHTGKDAAAVLIRVVGETPRKISPGSAIEDVELPRFEETA